MPNTVALKLLCLALLGMIAACGKENNPAACVNHPEPDKFCGEGKWCWTDGVRAMCKVKLDGGPDAQLGDRPDSMPADQIVAPAPDSSADLVPPDVAGAPDAAAAAPDAPSQPDLSPDSKVITIPDTAAPAPDVPTCTNACALNASRCGVAGGIQQCVYSGACTIWGPESANCTAPKTCGEMGTVATCSCPADGCTVGASRCGPGGGVQLCGPDGACTRWEPESSCRQYACRGSACRQVCDTDSDCSSSNFCEAAGPSCVPRCSAARPTNLVQNAGLDASASEFYIFDLSGAPRRVAGWERMDSVGCATSGSVLLTGGVPVVTEPYDVTAGTAYYVNFMIKQDPKEDVGYNTPCNISWCTARTCSGPAGEVLPGRSQDQLGPRGNIPPGSWQRVAEVITAPAGAVASMIICSSAGTGYADRFVVSSSGPNF